MYKGLPAWALSLLRCPVDGGELTCPGTAPFIVSGTVSCVTCAFRASVDRGILDLIDYGLLHDDSRSELERREEQWADDRGRAEPPSELDWAEIEPHLEALDLRPDHTVVEFGCGSGRYTRQMHKSVARFVAIDFSKQALECLAEQVGDNVALVRADVARLRLAERVFDRAVSTLTSNLPTQDVRNNLYRMAASGLVDGGRFVFGMHFYGWRARLARVKKSGYYTEESRIYRYYLTRDDARAEVAPFFRELKLQPVQTFIPLGGRLHLPLRRLSRLCERIPIAGEFSELLMGVAERPIAQSRVL
jgi:SAM-dependent methyltransferase